MKKNEVYKGIQKNGPMKEGNMDKLQKMKPAYVMVLSSGALY